MNPNALLLLIELMAGARDDVEREAYAWLSLTQRVPYRFETSVDECWWLTLSHTSWNSTRKPSHRRVISAFLPDHMYDLMPRTTGVCVYTGGLLRETQELKFLGEQHQANAYRYAAAAWGRLTPTQRSELQEWKP